MDEIKRNNWSMFKGKTVEEWYCGDCRKVCDDHAIVVTETNSKNICSIVSITCKECHILEKND